MDDEIRLRGPEPGDLGYIVHRHGVLYARECGWGMEFEGLVARIVGEFAKSHDPARERCFLAEIAGETVGSAFVVREDDATARLRLMLVEPSARSKGVGAALVQACLDFARGAGYAEIVLWTTDNLHAARRLYERHGFALVESHPHAEMGHGVESQTWRRGL